MLNIFTQKKSKKDEQLPFMYFYDIQNKKPDEFIIKTSSPSPSPSLSLFLHIHVMQQKFQRETKSFFFFKRTFSRKRKSCVDQGR